MYCELFFIIIPYNGCLWLETRFITVPVQIIVKKILITDTLCFKAHNTSDQQQKYILICSIQHNVSTTFIYNEHAFFKSHMKFMRKQCLHRHEALLLEGRVQDRILWPSCTTVGGKTSLFINQRHAKKEVMDHICHRIFCRPKRP